MTELLLCITTMAMVIATIVTMEIALATMVTMVITIATITVTMEAAVVHQAGTPRLSVILQYSLLPRIHKGVHQKLLIITMAAKIMDSIATRKGHVVGIISNQTFAQMETCSILKTSQILQIKRLLQMFIPYSVIDFHVTMK